MSPRLLALTCLLLASTARAQSITIIDDSFDDNDPAGSVTAPGLWKLQAVNGDNGVFENGGALTLFATTQPFTFAGLNTALDPRLNFFVRPLTITVEEMLLERGILVSYETVRRWP